MQLGRYELLSRIAVGGMAELFKARLHGPRGYQRLFAIKRLLPHLTDDEEHARMFMNEARIMSRLSHPNIPQLFELGEGPGGDLFMVMELIEGPHLHELMGQLQTRGRRASARLAGPSLGSL